MKQVERRIQRIFEFVKAHTEGFDADKTARLGVTTQMVAESLGLQRSNCSRDLNQLVKLGYLEKSQQRPVRYWLVANLEMQAVDRLEDRVTTAEKPAPTLAKKYVMSYKEDVLKPDKSATKADVKLDKNIFKKIIGANGSMKNAVEQAKAAILYPPKGLNCLITGPTGSGKTHFAHAMFQFAKAHGVVSSHQNLVVFNCADYANNPELLMSHLFGFSKGAFTGAESEKEGVIAQADGGMLFLDEIHRLPPEGQEMVFYFMDYGTYSRLGESGKVRQADVRIVGATTESLTSALLDTFVRRIPINIHLPAFTERPAGEQIDLVKVLFAVEADRIQRKFTLTEDVVKALIGSVTYGNIGQLKSNIQLVCARAFMNQMDRGEIRIGVEDLSEGIKNGLVQLGSNRKAAAEMAKYLQPEIHLSPNEAFLKFQQDSYELPYNLYDIIGDKAALLKAEGLDQAAINDFISKDINIHLRSFYKNHGFTFTAATDNKLAEFVDPKIIHLTQQIFKYATEALQYDFQQNFIYAVSLHISSFLQRIQQGENRQPNADIHAMALNFPQELAVAQWIQELLRRECRAEIPNQELDYLTVLLVSLRTKQESGRVGVVVAAHGNSTASSMAQVVGKLLGTQRLQAVDMPLEMSPGVAYEEVKKKVVAANEGNGVLVLVDMGSLTTFSEKLQLETQVKVKTLDMVTTPLLLEAVRRSAVLGTDLNELYESLRLFRGYRELAATPTPATSAAEGGSQPQTEKVIVAVCSSGAGTAVKLQEMLYAGLAQLPDQQVTVLTTSVVRMQETLKEIAKTKKIVAVTGIVNPEIGVPFVPLEYLMEHNVPALLRQLLLDDPLEMSQLDSVAAEQSESLTEEEAQKICVDYMNKSFTFINSGKLLAPLWHYVTDLFTYDTHLTKQYAKYVNLVMHLAGAVERVILGDSLSVEPQDLERILAAKMYPFVHHLSEELTVAIGVSLPVAEEFFVIQYFESQRN